MSKNKITKPDESIKKDEQERTRIGKIAMLEALEKTLGVITKACKLVDISRETHYVWYREDPEYKKGVDNMSEFVLDFVESSLHTQISEKNTAATIFYLKTKGRGRGYIERLNFVDETEYDERFKGKSNAEIAEELKDISDKMANAIK